MVTRVATLEAFSGAGFTASPQSGTFNCLAGDLVVVVIRAFNYGQTIDSASSADGSFTGGTQHNIDGRISARVFYRVMSSNHTGDTVTVGMSGSSDQVELRGAVYRPGSGNTLVADGEHYGFAEYALSVSSASFNTTGAGVVFTSTLAYYPGDTTFTYSGSYTAFGSDTGLTKPAERFTSGALTGEVITDNVNYYHYLMQAGLAIKEVAGSGGGEITGALTITETASTLSAQGAVGVSGAAAQTDAASTLASGGVVQVAGAAALTEAASTASSSAAVSVAGAAALTETASTVASAGQVLVAGAAGLGEVAESVAAAGQVAIVASAALTETAQALAGAGNVQVGGAAIIGEGGDQEGAGGGALVSGAATLSEAADSVTGSSGSASTGQATLAEAADQLLAVGTVSISAAFGVNEAGDSVVGSSGSVLVGVVSLAEAADTIVAQGAVTVTAQLSKAEGPDGGAGAGGSGSFGVVAFVEQADLLLSFGTVSGTVPPATAVVRFWTIPVRKQTLVQAERKTSYRASLEMNMKAIIKRSRESIRIDVDCSLLLGFGVVLESIVGSAVIEPITPVALSVSGVSISSQSMQVDGRTVSAGQVLSLQVSGGGNRGTTKARTEYVVRVQCETSRGNDSVEVLVPIWVDDYSLT